MSTGRAIKSISLAEFSRLKGYDYVCYDPECVAELFEKPAEECLDIYNKLEFSHWFDDANTAINFVREQYGPKKEPEILLVGSSMGGWISLAMAMKHPELVKGIILIAPALNFMRKYYQEWYDKLDSDSKTKLDAGETILADSSYGKMPLRKGFAESSHSVELDVTSPLNVTCPVRILHGVEDDSVPFQNSIQIMKLLKSQDVDLIYRKAGDHRLCREQDLDLLAETVERMMRRIAP